MKCFECNGKCITKYHFDNQSNSAKVTAVNKVCQTCGWESYKTKLPEKLL